MSNAMNRIWSRYQGRVRASLRRFACAQSGVAALEFAFITPVILALMYGLTTVASDVIVDRKLTLVARTLADLTGRGAVMTADDMDNLFKAGGVLMQPYQGPNFGIAVSSVLVTTSGTTSTGKVAWSCGFGIATPPPVGSNYAVPENYKTSASFIVAEASTTYNTITGTANSLKETIPWLVRNGDKVLWSGSPCVQKSSTS